MEFSTYSSQSLEETLLAKQKQGNVRCRGIMHGRVDEHALLYPGWCTQFGVELRFSQYHSASCGCSKEEEIGGDGKIPSCRTFYSNLNCARHPELFNLADPSTAPPVSAKSRDSTVEKMQKDIMKIVKATCHGGISDEHRLQDHAALLHKRNIHLLDIGNRKQFRVCSICSEHDIVSLRKNGSIVCRKCQLSTGKRKWTEKI